MVQKDKGNGVWSCPESVELGHYALWTVGMSKDQGRSRQGWSGFLHDVGLGGFGSKYLVFVKGRSLQSGCVEQNGLIC